MRAKLLLTIAVCLTANVIHAATLTVQLRDLTGGVAPGIHTIGIYLKTDTATSVYGFSGAQIDVISQETGHMSYTGTFSLTGSQVLSLGYSRINPLAVDATTANEQVSAMLPQPVTGLNDGDIDAVGFSIYNVPGNVDPSSGALGQTGAFEFVGKETWNWTADDTLTAWLTGAQYFTDSTGNNRADYDTVVSIPVQVIVVPEPGSFVLIGLGGVGLAAVARRRIGKA